MWNVSAYRLLAAFGCLVFFSSPSFGEFGTPLRPPSFNGHITYRAVASQPGNTTSYLAVGRAWSGSNYQGIISSVLVDGGWRNGSFTKGNTAWYPGQKLYDFSGAGFDNLCNTATYAYDGYIVACRSMKSNGYYDIYLVKVNSSGTLDTSFGTSGILATGIAGNSTDGHAFVRGIAYNSEVNTSHNGVVTIVGSVGKNSTNYRPFAASFDQQTGSAWGSKVTITSYVGTAVGVVYDSTTTDAYYIAATEAVAPHSFYVHKYNYSGGASDTSLDAFSSPWGTALSLSGAGGGAESIPSGITLGTTGAWGVDIIVAGSNKTSSSSGNWWCTAVALESSTGNLRTNYGDAGTDNLGVTLVTHDSSHDCIISNVATLGSGQVVLTGAAYTSGNSNYDQLAIKLDTDGRTVSGFGTSGFKLLSAGPADDVNNSAVKIGSYIYTSGRVDNASYYQGGDVQRYDATTGAVAPTVSSITANSPSVSAGQGVGLTVTVTYSDASTGSVPLSSLNLATSNSSVINLNSSSPYVYSTASSGTPTITATLSENLYVTANVDVSVPGYTTTNIRGDWDAAYANRSGPHSGSNSNWYDLTPNGYDGTSSSTSHATWSGSGTYSSPYTLSLDGQGYMGFGTNPLASQTKAFFSTWVKSSNVSSSSDAVILGNSSNAGGNGFTVRQHASYRDAVMALSPTAYFRLGEKTGTSAANLGSGSATGTYSGSPVLGATGGLTSDSDTSMTFDASNDFVRLSNASELNSMNSTGSFSAWIKTSNSAASARSIFANWDGTNGMQLYMHTGVLRFWSQTGGALLSGVTVSDGNWHHVVATSNGTTVSLYVDGLYRASEARTWANSTRESQIGSACSGANSTTCGDYWDGYIDEVAVFSNALTAAQIAVLYQVGTTGKTMDFVIGKSYQDAVLADSPAAYFKLGEAAGTTAKDLSGNGITGKYNSVTLGASGAIGGDSDTGVLFSSSTSSYVTAAAVAMTSAFTVESWIKFNNSQTQRSAFNQLTGAGVGWMLRTNYDTNLYFFVSDNSAAWYTMLGYCTNCITSGWHHVAAVFDGSQGSNSNRLKIYVDGVAQSLSFGTLPTSLPNTGQQIQLGASSATADIWDGWLDEFAVYTTALTSTQIAAHYNAGNAAYSGFCRGTSSLSENLWTHVSGIFSGSAATLYVNGRQDCTVSVSGGFTSPNSGLYAGATDSNTKNFTGSISDVKVYGTSNGSAVGAASDVKTNFDYTADTYRQNPVGSIVESGLVAHFDAASGKQGLRQYTSGCASTDLTWYDLSSSGADATLTGFASCGSSLGWQGAGTTSSPYSVITDGSSTDEYVQLSSTTTLDALQSGDYSMETWVSPNSLPTNANNNTLYSLLLGKKGQHIGIFLSPTGTFIGGHWLNSGPTFVSATGSVHDVGKWYHAVSTVSKTNGRIRLYINGVLENTGTFTAGSAAYASFGTNRWYLGMADPGASNYKYPADAKVAVARLYSGELTGADVYQNYDAQAERFRTTSKGNISTNGLVLNADAANGGGVFYQGNGCARTSWYDLSSSALLGTLTNFASCGSTTGWNGDGTTTVSGTNGPYRATFDGSNDYVSFGNASALSFDKTSSFTFETWMRSTSTTATIAILGKMGSSPFPGYGLYMNYPSTGVIGWQLINTYPTNLLTVYSTTTVNDGAWHHVALTYDGSSTAAGTKIYIDGTASTNTFANTLTGATTNSAAFTVGARSGSLNWGGEIAILRAYNRKLTSSEISANCAANSARFNGATCN
ncbi:hypothetical protein K2X33_03390 [bacterium]|nr:hypothetical protein [bacterium]